MPLVSSSDARSPVASFLASAATHPPATMTRSARTSATGAATAAARPARARARLPRHATGRTFRHHHRRAFSRYKSPPRARRLLQDDADAGPTAATAARCSASRLPTASPVGLKNTAAQGFGDEAEAQRRPTPTGRSSACAAPPAPAGPPAVTRSTASNFSAPRARHRRPGRASSMRRGGRHPLSERRPAAASIPSNCRSRGCRSSWGVDLLRCRLRPRHVRASRVAPTGNSCATRPPRRRQRAPPFWGPPDGLEQATAARRRGSIR